MNVLNVQISKIKLLFTVTAAALLLVACTAIQPEAAPPSQPTPPPAESTPDQPAETASPAPEEDTAQESETEDPLAGTAWVLESFGTVGAEEPAVGEVPVTLEFSTDGQMGGNGGCNSYGGSYELDGNTLAFGEIVSTLVACVDTAQMEQEVQYFDALQTASEFQLEGDRLTITYNEGQGALHFVRATDGPTEEPAPPTATPEPEANAPAGINIDKSAA